MGSKRFESTFDFHDLDVMIRCRSCGYQKKVTGHRFRFMFEDGMPCKLNEARRRLTCSKCGAKGTDVAPVPKMD